MQIGRLGLLPADTFAAVAVSDDLRHSDLRGEEALRVRALTERPERDHLLARQVSTEGLTSGSEEAQLFSLGTLRVLGVTKVTKAE